MAKKINITVLFFANLREIIGKKEISLEIPEATSVKEFKTIIGEAYPDLILALNSTLISVDKEFGFDDDLLPKNAQVALFPPVSGGRKYR